MKKSLIDFDRLSDTNKSAESGVNSDYDTRYLQPQATPPLTQNPDSEIDQVGIRGPAHIIRRFKALRSKTRYNYFELLEIMMDDWDQLRGNDT